MLRQGLLEAGVEDERIEVIADEQAALHRGLALARPGDLLLIFADAIERGWKQITQFSPEAAGAPASTTAPQIEPREFIEHDLDLGDTQGFVRDERGVRLAREEED